MLENRSGCFFLNILYWDRLSTPITLSVKSKDFCGSVSYCVLIRLS